ncbi:MAG: hypothetical protein M3Q26_04665 [Acidobacteriota bacterium]|nr:hypothetical protein [Acidobacteriota bacterium]
MSKQELIDIGKRLFADDRIPAAFKVTESQVSPSSVILVNYERAGEAVERDTIYIRVDTHT